MRRIPGPGVAIGLALIGGAAAGLLVASGVAWSDVVVSAIVAVVLGVAVARLAAIWRP